MCQFVACCTQHVISHGPCILDIARPTCRNIALCHLVHKCRFHQVPLRPPTIPLNFAHLFEPRNQNPHSQVTHPPCLETLPKRSLRYHPNAPLSARSDPRILLFETNHSQRNLDVVRVNPFLTGSIENLEGQGERAAPLMSRTPESRTVTVAHQGISEGLAFLMVGN